MNIKELRDLLDNLLETSRHDKEIGDHTDICIVDSKNQQIYEITGISYVDVLGHYVLWHE